MKTAESENVSKLKLNGKKEREAITRKKEQSKNNNCLTWRQRSREMLEAF